jgi:hypothetical protein
VQKGGVKEKSGCARLELRESPQSQPAENDIAANKKINLIGASGTYRIFLA